MLNLEVDIVRFLDFDWFELIFDCFELDLKRFEANFTVNVVKMYVVNLRKVSADYYSRRNISSLAK